MRILGIILTTLFGGLFLLLVWMVLSSRFGWTDGDPHGYGMVFGTLFATVLSIPLALVVPLIVEKATRAMVAFASLAAVLVIDVGLFVALATA